MAKIAIVCAGAEPRHLLPTFIIGSAAAAMGDEVILVFTPAERPALVENHLEGVQAKGMPHMGDLVSSGVTSFLADTKEATRTFSF